ncbi:DUF7563 family protein [Natrarchaeobius halalkaliphilus]
MSDKTKCRMCGSHVTPQFRRTHGDENQVAHRCIECDTDERLGEGGAAGQELEKADPIDEPERFNCGFDVPAPVQEVVATDRGESNGE